MQRLSNMTPHYEIELELIGNGDKDKGMTDILQYSVKYLGYLLQVTQTSNAIMSESQKNTIMREYQSLVRKDKTDDDKHDWIGPQPASMNLDHIRDHSESGWDGVVSIHSGYAVTPKADGDRAMLFISSQGLYLIYRRMDIQYTGLRWKCVMEHY